MSSMVLDGAMPRSRSTDPITSVDAGRKADLKGSQALVMRVFREYPDLANHELVQILMYPFGEWDCRYKASRIRSARAELVQKGLLEWTGEYRSTSSGGRARVYRTVDD